MLKIDASIIQCGAYYLAPVLTIAMVVAPIGKNTHQFGVKDSQCIKAWIH